MNMQREKLILKNNFHFSKCRSFPLLIDKNEVGKTYMLSAAQVERANRVLCGMSDCHCGGLSYNYSFNEDSLGNTFLEVDDKS